MIRTTIMLLAFALATFASQVQAQNSVNVRIQDITTLGSDKETIFLGRGLVTGLAGTGDSKSKETTQMAYDFAMATITRKDAKPEDYASENQAGVAVTLKVMGNRGATTGLRAEVSTFDTSSSLKGGTLQRTVLRIGGADTEIYAVASGPIRTEGTIVTKGSVAVSLIKDVNKSKDEIETDPQGRKRKVIRFNLDDQDAKTQTAIITAINDLATKLGVTGVSTDGDIADADPIAFEANGQSQVKVYVPTNYEKNTSEFISLIQGQNVNANSVARIVINKSTGVMGWNGNVKIAAGVVTVGGVTVNVPASGIIGDRPQAGDEVVDPAVAVGGAPQQMTMNQFIDALNSLGLSIDQKHALVIEMKELGMLVGKLVVKE